MAQVTYRDDMIVEAAGRTALTPNFRASEYTAPDGSIRVHRELVAGVQMLRDRVGSMRIVNVRPRGVPRGLGVIVAHASAESAVVAAGALRAIGVLERVELRRNGLLLTIDPAPRSLEAELAFDTGLQVVADYETRGDPYQQVTGNFDGAGLSFGVIQFNFKSGTLQKLFRQFRDVDGTALAASFPTPALHEELWRVVDGPGSEAIRWGNGDLRGGIEARRRRAVEVRLQRDRSGRDVPPRAARLRLRGVRAAPARGRRLPRGTRRRLSGRRAGHHDPQPPLPHRAVRHVHTAGRALAGRRRDPRAGARREAAPTSCRSRTSRSRSAQGRRTRSTAPTASAAASASSTVSRGA